MSLIPINLANTQLMLQNVCQQMRTFLTWLNDRNVTYSQNMTTANMTAMSIAAADQTSILAFIADIARMVSFANGNVQAVAGNVHTDVVNILGVL